MAVPYSCPHCAAGRKDFVISEAGGLREYESYYHVDYETALESDEQECPDHWRHQVERLEAIIKSLQEQLHCWHNMLQGA